jgi:hypothetical protein
VTDENQQQVEGQAQGENALAGFKTPEELAAAYTALKASQVAPKVEEPAKVGDLQVQKVDANDDTAVADALKNAGLDQSVFTQEFASTGTLSEESFKALEAKGFPKAMVDVYLDGLKGRQSAYETQLYSATGGKDGYAELLKWAGSSLNDAEIDAFNAVIQTGNPEQAKLAVQGLVSRKNAGKAVLLHGKTGNTSGVTGYASAAEARAAVNDPRYRSDPAYRKAHEARLMASEY